MIMSWIFTGFLAISFLSATVTGHSGSLAPAILEGAQKGITLAISLAGALCLWTGVGKLMEHIGITNALSALLNPLLNRLFPESRKDAQLKGYLSANICANFLGLGNAATPMGIQAAKRLVHPEQPGIATDSLCRLIVLNTASIQLIPSTVAAVRSSAGCSTPFDILPAVWITSLCSAGVGVAAACMMGRMKKQ